MQADGQMCEQHELLQQAACMPRCFACHVCVAVCCAHIDQHGLACQPDHSVTHADVLVLMPVQSCVILMQLQAIMHWCRLVHTVPSYHSLHTNHALHTFAFPENGSHAAADELHLCIRQSCCT